MALTVPQVILLNHAAWVNHENHDRRMKAKESKKKKAANEIEKDPEVLEGKKMSELEPAELSAYLSNIGI
jgi:hypothetical protein